MWRPHRLRWPRREVSRSHVNGSPVNHDLLKGVDCDSRDMAIELRVQGYVRSCHEAFRGTTRSSGPAPL